MNIINRVKRKILSVLNNDYSYRKNSYAQQGEDLILEFLFTWELRIKEPSYIDIGAHHPFYLSNTYIFYKKGCKGVSIEPDPVLFENIKKHRPREICLNVGIGEKEGVKEFFIMSTKTLNTFSEKEAHSYVGNPNFGDEKIERIIKTPIKSINSIFKEYNNFQSIDLVSIDVEGMDFEILESIDFDEHMPKVICIEVVRYDETKKTQEYRDEQIYDFMYTKGYMLYADTFINAIFVREDVWRNRHDYSESHEK